MNNGDRSSAASYLQTRTSLKGNKTSKQEPIIHYISSDIPGKKWDGSPIRIITRVKPHEKKHPSSKYLSRPLFHYSDNTVQTAENPLINSEDCDPVFLLNLADRLAHNDMPYPAEIKDKVVRGIRAVFLEGATPQMFYNDLSQYVDLIFKDDEHPKTYRATAKLFFGTMAKKSILAFDIHDLLHHPLQLSAWPEQFQYISSAASKAHDMQGEHTERLKGLTRLVWLATFEESLVALDGQLVSFGCLNWLAPSETPFDKVEDIRLLPVPEQKIAYKWHYLDALKDMYRIQYRNSKSFGTKVEWLERLGYDADRWFIELVSSSDARPFENLDFYDADKFTIQAPPSPEKLFANAIKLIEEEFGAAGR